MSDARDEQWGRLGDEAEDQETSSSTTGAAARGDDDPAQGSLHSGGHPVSQDFPDEVDRHDKPIGDEPPPN